jgi:hypothetical protein
MTLEEVKTYFNFFQNFSKISQNRLPYRCFKDGTHTDFSIVEKDNDFYTICNICNNKARLSDPTLTMMKETYLAHKDD